VILILVSYSSSIFLVWNLPLGLLGTSVSCEWSVGETSMSGLFQSKGTVVMMRYSKSDWQLLESEGSYRNHNKQEPLASQWT